MTRRSRIVVLGGINIDLIALTPRLPEPGETVPGDDFYTTPGGEGREPGRGGREARRAGLDDRKGRR